MDRQGIPLAADVTAANLNDHLWLPTMLEALPALHTGRPGRPRRRPQKLHADKGYDTAASREACQSRSITPRIARKGIESSERLGRHRWVVERTFSWLSAYRRLMVRYERSGELHRAFLILACSLICLRFI